MTRPQRVAIRGPHPGEEDPEIVVDLGGGGHGGAGVAGGAALLDGDGRREALDVLHVRLVHQFQELAGVGREALHVAALALGVEDVEGQGGFAGPADAVMTFSRLRGNSTSIFLRLCPGRPG